LAVTGAFVLNGLKARLAHGGLPFGLADGDGVLGNHGIHHYQVAMLAEWDGRLSPGNQAWGSCRPSPE
jgi:hypothetical protein